jgi:hypothetical protein
MISLSFVERECFRQIFEAIGTTNQYFVEVGYDGLFDKESIPRWQGLLIDKSGALDINKKVKVIHQFVTAENINSILTENQVPAETDFFGIDIDGNDYHVLRALTATTPRVIITEYNASFGPDRAITIKYDPAFERHGNYHYHGASLMAFAKLLNARDYALVATDYYGINAFFVKRSEILNKLKELNVADAWRPHGQRNGSWQEQFFEIKDLEYEEV